MSHILGLGPPLQAAVVQDAPKGAGDRQASSMSPQPWTALIARTAIESMLKVWRKPRAASADLLVSQKKLVNLIRRGSWIFLRRKEIEGLKAVDDGFGKRPAAGAPQESSPHGRIEAASA